MTAMPDSIQDACALVQCSLRGDAEGAGVIKTNAADLGEAAGILADVVGELFRSLSRVLPGGDPQQLLERVREGLAGDGEA
jgi:hypothetical protein